MVEAKRLEKWQTFTSHIERAIAIEQSRARFDGFGPKAKVLESICHDTEERRISVRRAFGKLGVRERVLFYVAVRARSHL